jgi:spore maturation protein CgeB
MAGSSQIYFVESLEIEEYYSDGREILLVDGAEDLEQILDQYLDAPQEIAAIRKATQNRTLQEHTYEHRARQILAMI